MQIGTLTTGVGVVTTITLNYLPAYIYYIAATQLTGFKCNVAGDGVVLDLDATGLTAMNGIRRYGATANDNLISLADGFVPNKVTELSFTNSAAQTPAVYGFSMKKGLAYVVTRRQTVLASSGQKFENFAYIGFSTIGATDEMTVEFRDGHTQKFVAAEVLAWLSLLQNDVAAYAIDNLEGMIRYIHWIPTANAVAYVMKFVPIGNIG